MASPIPTNLAGVLGIGLILAFTIVYFVAKLVSVGVAKITRHKLISHRLFGVLAVVAASVYAGWRLYGLLFRQEVYNALAPYQQGQYFGEIVGVPVLPALLVICIVAIRGRSAARRARAQQKIAVQGLSRR